MTGDLTDKEKIVKRLKGEELKEFRLEVTNPLRVTIEATSEEEAERIFNEKIEGNYDFPYEEADDYDGWEIQSVEEC